MLSALLKLNGVMICITTANRGLWRCFMHECVIIWRCKRDATNSIQCKQSIRLLVSALVSVPSPTNQVGLIAVITPTWRLTASGALTMRLPRLMALLADTYGQACKSRNCCPLPTRGRFVSYTSLLQQISVVFLFPVESLGCRTREQALAS